jgi:hypothetical protein
MRVAELGWLGGVPTRIALNDDLAHNLEATARIPDVRDVLAFASSAEFAKLLVRGRTLVVERKHYLFRAGVEGGGALGEYFGAVLPNFPDAADVVILCRGRPLLVVLCSWSSSAS